jgi:hypothetical protein
VTARRKQTKDTGRRDLKQEFLDGLSGWETTPEPFWTDEQAAAADRYQQLNPEAYDGMLRLYRLMSDKYYEYVIYEDEDPPAELPPDTLLVVLMDQHLDPGIDAYFSHEGPKPPPELWVRGKHAVKTESWLQTKKEALERHGATLEDRLLLQPFYDGFHKRREEVGETYTGARP